MKKIVLKFGLISGGIFVGLSHHLLRGALSHGVGNHTDFSRSAQEAQAERT